MEEAEHMTKQDIIKSLEKKIIVSCQALYDEPLFSSSIMGKMALAACLGGAAGIRANTGVDIKEIRKNVSVPIIGICKKCYSDSTVYITPTFVEIKEVALAGADIIAIDATNRIRPNDEKLCDLIFKAKNKFPNKIFMADISTLEEGIYAEELGFDLISTTLSGYTTYSKKAEGPDFDLINQLSANIRKPVIAEGRIETLEDAKQAILQGAYALVIGGAITRPQIITKNFVTAISEIDYSKVERQFA